MGEAFLIRGDESTGILEFISRLQKGVKTGSFEVTTNSGSVSQSSYFQVFSKTFHSYRPIAISSFTFPSIFSGSYGGITVYLLCNSDILTSTSSIPNGAEVSVGPYILPSGVDFTVSCEVKGGHVNGTYNSGKCYINYI